MRGIEWLHSLEGAAPRREVEWLDVLVYAEEQNPGKGAAARWLADELGVSVRSAQRYLAVTTPGVKETQQPSRHVVTEAVEQLSGRIQREWDAADAEEQRTQVADLLRAIRRVRPGKIGVRSVSRGRGRGGRARMGNLESSRSIPGELSVDLSDVADQWEQGNEAEAAVLLSAAIIDAYGNRGDIDELSSSIRIIDYPAGMDYT